MDQWNFPQHPKEKSEAYFFFYGFFINHEKAVEKEVYLCKYVRVLKYSFEYITRIIRKDLLINIL